MCNSTTSVCEEGAGTPSCARNRPEVELPTAPPGMADPKESSTVCASRSPRQRLLAPLAALLPRSDLPGARQKTPWGTNRWFLLFLYALYAFATSAVFYGWTALTELIFKNEGLAHLCAKNPVTGAYDPDLRLQGKLYICDSQDAAVQKLYTLTFAVCCTMSACAGTLMDGLGPLLTALLGQIFNFTGWLLFSFSSSHFLAYHAAFVFIGLGSDTSFLPTLTIRRLFPGSPGLIITILGSAASASFGVPLILTAAVNGGHASVRTACLTYCGLGPALCIIIALLFIPLRGFSIDDEGKVWDDAAVVDNASADETCVPNTVLQGPPQVANGQGEEDSDQHSKKHMSVVEHVLRQAGQLRDSFLCPSFWRQMMSVRFGLIVVYFVVVGWSSAYYQQAARRMFSPPVVQVMEILLPFSFVPCIILGKLADMYGIVKILYVVNSSGVLMYGLSFAKNANFPGYLSVIFFMIYMSLFTSQVFVYIEETFSPQHFGKLIGIASMVGGLLSLATNPLYEDVTLKKDHGNPLSIQIAMTALLCLQYATIVALGFLRRKNPKPYGLKEDSAGTTNGADTLSRFKDPVEALRDLSGHLQGGGTDVSGTRGSEGKAKSAKGATMSTSPAEGDRSASTELV